MHRDHLSASTRNCFGAHMLDRAAARRLDPDWLALARADGRSRFVPLSHTRNLFDRADRPAYLAPAMLAGIAGGADDAIFLCEEEGRAYFAVDLTDHPAEAIAAGAGEFRDLKAVAGLLPRQDAALLAYARAMVHWHRSHRFCGRCGFPTHSDTAGHVRRCADAACGRQHFPRTDPAIIVLVTRGDRALLARHPQWAPRRFATLAGFVEPGETLEAAVLREVREETGIELDTVRYHSSQPWPFPGSIMLGFTAVASAGELRLDPTEVAEARWLTRSELAQQICTGELELPTAASIAFRLIEDWRLAEPAAG